jgi:hypothetical protein
MQHFMNNIKSCPIFFDINKKRCKFVVYPVWTGINNIVAGGVNASEKIVAYV